MINNEYEINISIEKTQERFLSKTAALKNFLSMQGFTIIAKDDFDSWLELTATKSGTDTGLTNDIKHLLIKMKSDNFRIDVNLKRHKPSLLLENIGAEDFQKIISLEEGKIIELQAAAPHSYTFYYQTSEARDKSYFLLTEKFPTKEITKNWDDISLFDGNSLVEKPKLAKAF